MSMHDDILKVLVSEEELKAKVAELGAQISKDYEGRNLVLVSILKGSVVFMADLMRAVSIPCSIDFMVVSSYGGGNTTSTGLVKIIKDLDGDLSGKDVLIVEDILDTGITLSNLVPMLKMRNPNSVKICTILDKPSRRKADIAPDYEGFAVPDEFVVGYGLDYDEKYRNLPYIGVLKPSVYEKQDTKRELELILLQPKRPRINPLILALALAAVLMVWSVMGSGSGSTSGSTMSYSTVVHYFEHNQVTAFTLDRNTSVITLNLKEGDLPLPDVSSTQSTVQSTGGLLSGMFSSSSESTGAVQEDDGTVTVRYKLPYAYVFIENVDKYIESYDAANPDAPMTYDYTSLKETIPWMEIIFYLGMLGCTGFLLFSMMRGGVGGGGGIMNVGKAKVKDEHENKKTATFADVAGEDEEKEELKEVVEFLKSPDKFNSLGARIPHGVLLVGPPGTGKTLLARACAGEAGVPFYSISGSDFVEMYVGVGASRVRDLFDKAKKTMPCIIFIDEIDAVGRQRGAGLGGGHDEREQTLNQLLVEMDGFEANDGVIVMAATNRADILDKALLRPGRFDRQVYVGLPDVKGREEILKVHTKNKPLAPDVSLKVIAQRTAGFAGADLENLVNEAALLAARRSRKAITMEDIEEASMKVMAGPEKKSRVVTPEEKKLTAYHEAGHAVAGFYCKHHPRVHEITIIPRGQAGGYTMYLPEKDRSYVTKGEMFEDIVSSLGGRVAEQLILDDISTGASNDLQQATNIARQMITKYGFSERLGPVVYGTSQEETFLGRDLGQGKGYSETTAAEIDSEMRDIIDEAYETCRRTLTEHIDQLHALAQALMEREKLNEKEFNAVMAGETLPQREDPDAKPAEAQPAVQPVEQAETAEAAEPAEPAEAVDAAPQEAPAPETPDEGEANQ